jgi:hypothetical protein
MNFEMLQTVLHQRGYRSVLSVTDGVPRLVVNVTGREVLVGPKGGVTDMKGKPTTLGDEVRQIIDEFKRSPAAT